MTTDVWPGSELSLAGTEFSGTIPETPDTLMLVFLIATGVAVMIFYGRLLSALKASLSFFRSSHSSRETLGNKYLCDSIRLIFFLFIPFYAFALWKAGFGSGYWWSLLAVAGLFVFRKTVYMLAAWLTSGGSAFRDVEKTGYGVAILMIALSLLPYPVLLFVPDIPAKIIKIYLIVVLISAFTVYARRSADIISSTGFSIFFWVLYLCALELIPICVVAKLMMYGY